MQVDHVGYAVSDIARAMHGMELLGYCFGPVINDEDRNVRIAFGNCGECRVELVCPLDSSKESPVDLYLSKVRSGPYHICYLAEDFENDIAGLEGTGFKVTIPPRPAIAFGGRRVVFLYSLQVGLVELVESAMV